MGLPAKELRGVVTGGRRLVQGVCHVGRHRRADTAGESQLMLQLEIDLSEKRQPPVTVTPAYITSYAWPGMNAARRVRECWSARAAFTTAARLFRADRASPRSLL